MGALKTGLLVGLLLARLVAAACTAPTSQQSCPCPCQGPRGVERYRWLYS
jgi:hypothetical protein